MDESARMGENNIDHAVFPHIIGSSALGALLVLLHGILSGGRRRRMEKKANIRGKGLTCPPSVRLPAGLSANMHMYLLASQYSVNKFSEYERGRGKLGINLIRK
jgi:hypothetical protein